MNAVASIDGVIVPLDEARVGVLDRGFLYGDAVFEALRTYRGVPDALDLHLARLEQSSAILHITPPVARDVLAREVIAAVAATAAPECYLRIMITRGDLPDALPPMGAGRARRVILARPLAPSAPSLYREGIRVVSVVAPPSPLWAGAKPSAYLNNLLAIGEAQRVGAADALLLGAYGELLEGATSSVFVVQKGAVSTPPLALGILPGITRDRVLACAVAEGLAPRERLLHIHDAYAADEVFLTSSVRTVVPVVAVDGKPVGDGSPGPITQRLAAAYRALVERL
ncbi:MAG: aminotransferase class IV [Polyangiales bacterium]